MATQNEQYDGCHDMKVDLDESIKTRDMEQPMPSETTTEKLMRPGGQEELEG
jgi:uncharacterized protein YaaW (UPF0174 family)